MEKRFIGVLLTIAMVMSLMPAFGIGVSTDDITTGGVVDFDNSTDVGVGSGGISLPGQNQTVHNLDLSALSETDEDTSEEADNYSYTWTVEDNVKTLELTLNNANFERLCLPCKSYGELYIIINTIGDSYIGEVNESHVFNYSYQWNSITFCGEAKLEIGYMNTQGGDNNHIITVSEDAKLNISGDGAGLAFGASGSSNSTLNVNGSLEVNGNVYCGNLKIGGEAYLKCKRITLSGSGAHDDDEYKNSFVVEDGGVVEAVGNPDETDEDTEESYAALVIMVGDEEAADEEILVLPAGYLSEGYRLVRLNGYLTVDDSDEKKPESTILEYGIIYASTKLTLDKNAIVTYMIIFVDESGDVLQSGELEYGETPVYTGEEPTKDADAEYTYTFAGWSPDIVAVTGTATYTATYTQTPINTPVQTVYTIEFNSNGGSNVDAVVVSDGGMLSMPSAPTKSGYTFKGWFKDEELLNEYDFETVVTGGFTLYAKWQKKQSSGGGGSTVTRYTVKFDTDGGSAVSSATVNRNAMVIEPENPRKDGYTFNGWYTDKDFKNIYNFENKVTTNITLYAKWEKYDDDTSSGAGSHNCPSLNFEDLDITQWYHHDTDYVIENGIFRGTAEKIFEPHTAQTRAMMITVLYRTEGEPAVNSSIPFSDVDMGSYYANAVIWGQHNGIIKGYSELEFGPDDNITREQIAAIMHRYAQYKDKDVSVGEDTNILSFDDYNEISEYAIPSMQWAVGIGLIKGRSESTLNPTENAERVEIAAILHRFALDQIR